MHKNAKHSINSERTNLVFSAAYPKKTYSQGKKQSGNCSYWIQWFWLCVFLVNISLIIKAIPSHESSWEFNGLYSFISNFRNIQLFLFIFIPGNTYRIMSDLKVETDITCITRIAASQVGRTMIMHVETFKMDVIISVDI
jgi:hypothetical protein